MTFIWHNGAFKKSNTPILTAHDRLRLGEGIFISILATDGHVHLLQDHIQKLKNAASLMWPDWPFPAMDDVTETITQLLHKNQATRGHYAINCTITGGEGGSGITPPTPINPNIIIRCVNFTHDATTPIHAHIATTVRRNEYSPLASLKYTNYTDHIFALREAGEHGANEAILLNTAGNVCCSTVGTIVILKKNQLITPPLSDGCQKGVTRSLLIKKRNVSERSISPKDLLTCDGAYLLNSLRGARTISSINRQDIPTPKNPDLSKLHLDPS